MKKVLVVAGPTASGKSSFAVKAAKVFHGEIISGDSIQVYKGLDIGSGKVTEEEMQGVPHHLIDILEPDVQYTAADFQIMARECIENCTFPIIAGGTGLYLKACLYDYAFADESEETSVDSDLEKLTNEELYAILLEKDPEQSKKIHMHNRRRLLRSLTILKRTGIPQSEIEKRQRHEPIYNVMIVGCTMPRDILYERINARVHQMMENGLEQEVRSLLAKGCTFMSPGMRGIGYQEWQDYFSGLCTIEEVEERIAAHSRQYAKRQYTWLNHQMDVNWFDVRETSEHDRIMEEIRKWLEA